jgi:hypothetical protein
MAAHPRRGGQNPAYRSSGFYFSHEDTKTTKDTKIIALFVFFVLFV